MYSELIVVVISATDAGFRETDLVNRDSDYADALTNMSKTPDNEILGISNKKLC